MNTKTNNHISILDLFSGAGGLSLGFEKAGFEIAAAIESHEDPVKTYKFNRRELDNPPVIINSNISRIKCSTIKNLIKNKIDVIIGGPPCQGFSLRGKRKKNDPRNRLIYDYFSFVKEIQPEIFVLENVSGLAMKYNRPFLKRIINRAKKVGYKLSLELIDSSEYGVPQNRIRLIIIGTKTGSKIYFPRKSNSPTVEKLKNDMKIESANYLRSPKLINKVSVLEALDDIAYDKVSTSPIAYESEANYIYSKNMRKNSKQLYNHITTKHTIRVLERFSYIKCGQGMEAVPDQIRTQGRSVQRMKPLQRSRTITSTNEDAIHYKLNRIITIREMARLQSFPDDYIFLGARTTGSDRRKTSVCQVQQVANSVPPLMAQAIAEGVIKMLGQKSNGELWNFIRKLNRRKKNNMEILNNFPEILV